MKNLLSRKFLLTVLTSVLIALNDALSWGFDQGTITAVVTVVVGWIAIEGTKDVAVAIKNKTLEVAPYDAKSLDSVRQDSEDAKFTASN